MIPAKDIQAFTRGRRHLLVAGRRKIVMRSPQARPEGFRPAWWVKDLRRLAHTTSRLGLGLECHILLISQYFCRVIFLMRLILKIESAMIAFTPPRGRRSRQATDLSHDHSQGGRDPPRKSPTVRRPEELPPASKRVFRAQSGPAIFDFRPAKPIPIAVRDFGKTGRMTGLRGSI